MSRLRHVGLAVRARTAPATRRLLAYRARDITDRSMKRSALVLAAHPDDEVFGCGATILRKVGAGAEVHIAIATDGRSSVFPPDADPDDMVALRKTEAIAAASAMGLPRDHLHFLDFEDGALADHVLDATDRIGRIVRDIAPDEVLVNWDRDPHPDHRALSRAARRAIGSDCEILEYPIWYWATAPWAPGIRQRRALAWFGLPLQMLVRAPVLAVSIEGFVSAKRAAFAAYATRRNLSPTFIEGFFRGPEIFFPVASR